MKRILSLAILTITASTILVITPGQAQILTDVNDLTTMSNVVATRANYSNVELSVIVATIIKMLLSLLGIIFLALTISAGFRWMTAAGNEEAVKKAQSTMQSAIIGLVIVLMAYAITYFLFKYLPFSGGGMPNAV
jgi:uncharacterized membrane protein YwzB